jgi:hypothetical protein
MQTEENMPIALLELASQALDITNTQRQQIEQSYRGVAEAICENKELKDVSPHIQPQGSVLLGTVVKPSPDAEFDVDATCRLDLDHQSFASHVVYAAVLDALREHGVYKGKVEAKNRCVRVKYTEERYHLDMTPCVPHGGIVDAIHVPDRALKCWKPSNPQLYAKLFEEAAAKVPVFTFDKRALFNTEQRVLSAKIDPLPPEEKFQKKLLKRTVQLLKRHRDLHFQGRADAVISIIVTTLAARGYARMVHAREYESILDFLIAVVDSMPFYIDTREVHGSLQYRIENPAIPDENFADKWNLDPALAVAFTDWHKRIAAELKEYKRLTTEHLGNRVLMEKAAAIYGEVPAKRAASEFLALTAEDHRTEVIRITPTLGLGAVGVTAPKTSYYGV